MNKELESKVIDLFKTMKVLKNHPERNQFCNNFDIEYEKLKDIINELDIKINEN